MADRPGYATVQLKVRMKEPLREDLAEKAKEHGVSMNQEIVNRLLRSLSEDSSEDNMLGDRDIADLTRMIASSLSLGGRRAAFELGHEEWTTREWMQDPRAFATAIQNMLASLTAQNEDLSPKDHEELSAVVYEAVREWFQQKGIGDEQRDDNETREE
ncbi:MAG: Arc family DNA-binding protein [Pseudomonadota bacterium]